MARAGLTPAVIVAVAAELADEVGFDGVTLAALAARFGVAVPSLYKHVAGIDDVRRRVAIRSTQEFGEAVAAALAGASGSSALRAMADAYRSFALRYPGRYEATVRAPAPDDAKHVQAAEAVLAMVLALLRGYGLTGDDAIDAARAVRSALHGFIALEAAGGFGLPRDVDRSYDRLVAALHGALSRWRGP